MRLTACSLLGRRSTGPSRRAGDYPRATRLLTPRARDVLDRAVSLAERNGQRHVGVEHLLLALALEPQRVGIAAAVLDELGATSELVHRLERLLRSDWYGRLVPYAGDDAPPAPEARRPCAARRRAARTLCRLAATLLAGRD